MAEAIVNARHTAKIYALVDPRDGRRRYVGQTRGRYLCNRLAQHVCRTTDGTPKSQWVEELLSLGMRPEIELLEEVSVANGDLSESRWIGKLARELPDLLNRRDGGLNGAMCEESKAKISAFRSGYVGWKHDPRTRAKIGRSGEQNSAAKLTEEVVLKVRSLYGTGIKQARIADTFSLSRQVVSSIVLRKSWAHL